MFRTCRRTSDPPDDTSEPADDGPEPAHNDSRRWNVPRNWCQSEIVDVGVRVVGLIDKVLMVSVLTRWSLSLILTVNIDVDCRRWCRRCRNHRWVFADYQATVEPSSSPKPSNIFCKKESLRRDINVQKYTLTFGKVGLHNRCGLG